MLFASALGMHIILVHDAALLVDEVRVDVITRINFILYRAFTTEEIREK
jgi:hypothetical protein